MAWREVSFGNERDIEIGNGLTKCTAKNSSALLDKPYQEREYRTVLLAKKNFAKFQQVNVTEIIILLPM